MKPWYRREWVILLIANVVVVLGTALIDNAADVGMPVWAVSLVTVLLSAVRMHEKTKQDVKLIERGTIDRDPPALSGQS